MDTPTHSILHSQTYAAQFDATGHLVRVAEQNNIYQDADVKYWLAVHRAPRIGCRTFLKLLFAFASPQAILAAKESQLQQFKLAKATRQALREPDWQAIQQDLDWLAAHHGSVVTLADKRYPDSLKQIPDPPPMLFVLGNAELLSQPQVAMVGSRNPTPGGAQTAYDFSAALVRAGLTVTSGMALGIDGQCHQGALHAACTQPSQTGQPGASSIAVIGTGIDRVYPARHKELAKLLATHGAIISEFPPGTPPLAQNFPLRNRIISGMSLGVVVVEAALQSGSLITARQALEQNREVFAIPGSIHTPQSRGCHSLIRQGAKLVETAQDVLEEIQFSPLAEQVTGRMSPVSDAQAQAPAPASEQPTDASTAAQNGTKVAINLDENQQQLLSCVGFEPTSTDEIIARSGLTAEQVCSMLLVLELHNLIVSTASGQYSRINAHSD